MDNKNHEQYLEQIEIAIAETTKDLMEKHNGDLRAMANVCAEKQVEINRLKQYQLNDRKTIKQLRGHFQEAVDEATELKEERENASYELAGELEDINTRWAEDKEADRIVIDGLKKTIHQQGDQLIIFHAKEEKPHNASSATAHAVLEIKNSEIKCLKEEIEFLKSQLDVGGFMNFSKYNDNDPN